MFKQLGYFFHVFFFSNHHLETFFSAKTRRSFPIFPKQKHVSPTRYEARLVELIEARERWLKVEFSWDQWRYIPSGKLTKLLNMAIEIVDLPINNGDFP